MSFAAAHQAGSPLNNAYLLAGAIAAVVAVVVAATPFVRAMRRGGKRIGVFLDDWGGTEGRPGVDRRPGVMERLDEQDKQLDIISKRITVVEGELQANTGTSVKDAIHRIDRRVKWMEQRKLDEGYRSGQYPADDRDPGGV